MSLAWLNGDLLEESDARLPISDRGFTLADGVFETILSVASGALWISDHLQRLEAGARLIGLSIPYTEDVIVEAIRQLLSSRPSDVCAIRLTVTRGPTFARGLWPRNQSWRPTCLLTVSSTSRLPSQNFIISRTTRRNEHSPISRIKSLNYGDNIIARREAHARHADDALMLNTAGNVACATAGNLFCRIKGQWFTPTLTDGILCGLARKRLILRLTAVEASLSAAQILASEAVFVSNSLGFAQINSIDGHQLPGKFDEAAISSIYQD